MMMTHERAGGNSPAGRCGGEVAGAADERGNAAYACLVSKSEKLFETRIEEGGTVELWNTADRLLTVVVKGSNGKIEVWTKQVSGAEEVNEVLAEFKACAGGE